MVLRKITVDNSVRYIPKSEQTKEIKQNRIKNKNQSEKIQPVSGGGKSNMRKQDKKLIKNLSKILQLVDLEYLQNSMYMYMIL